MAKTYKNLFEEFCEFSNFYDGFIKARKNKRYREDVLCFSSNLEGNLTKLLKDVRDGSYRPVAGVSLSGDRFNSGDRIILSPNRRFDMRIINRFFALACLLAAAEIFAADSAQINCYYTIMDTIPPQAVSISSFSALSYSQIKVTYNEASDSESGLAVSPYYVEAALAQDFSGASGSGWTAATDETFSALARNKRYYFRVKAKDKAGNISTSTVQEKKTQPCVWQEKTTTRTGPNAFGFEGDGVWTWEVPAKGGTLVTIKAFVRYNSAYGAAAKPKLTLSNKGVNSSDQMTGGADAWEELTVSGTPSSAGVLFLKAEGFSTALGAKYFIDDIQVQ